MDVWRFLKSNLPMVIGMAIWGASLEQIALAILFSTVLIELTKQAVPTQPLPPFVNPVVKPVVTQPVARPVMAQPVVRSFAQLQELHRPIAQIVKPVPLHSNNGYRFGKKAA